MASTHARDSPHGATRFLAPATVSDYA